MAQAGEVYERIPGHRNACAHTNSAPLGNVNYGYCRRSPPVAVERQGTGLPRGIWPVVGYDDFRGKHAPAA